MMTVKRYRRLWPWALSLVLGAVVSGFAWVRRGVRWGSTADEVAMRLPGGRYLDGGPPARLVMTRAVDIDAPPEVVWPWIAQLGRGAGWYSYDCIDNGGRASAWHLVSWIPPPQVGDASPVGYLRHLEEGRGLTWWVTGEPFMGATTRMVFDMHLSGNGGKSRLVARMSGDASGWSARPVLWIFAVVDSVMAQRQLLGIKERAESRGTRTIDPGRAETGDRSQYQLNETIYASGERAGVAGREKAARWRETWIRGLA